jgi:hypothetical protein
MFSINRKIIEELGRQVGDVGGRLVVVDASRYFGDRESVAAALREVCRENRLGYIPLYEHLSKANAEGISTRWADDGHFNEVGNEILAKGLFDWIARYPPLSD